MTHDDLARALLDGLPDALVVSDAQGIIRHWNAGSDRIFGFSEAEALGSSLDNFLQERERSLAWLPSLSQAAWETEYQAPFGPIRAGDMPRPGGATLVRRPVQVMYIPIASAVLDDFIRHVCSFKCHCVTSLPVRVVSL